MEQRNLEMQTETLAEHLEKDVNDIERQEVVHCFQMALKRLRNLMEIVDAETSQWRAEQAAGSSSAGSSMQHAADSSSGSAPGSSVDNPYLV